MTGYMGNIEKLIKEKYGEIGLRIYNLIDGQRTAEDVMIDADVTEKQLIEILDFFDEHGFIRLYPKGSSTTLKEE